MQNLEIINSQPKSQITGLTRDEQLITEANQGVFIQDATHEELGACLLYCFSLTGLTIPNYPNEAGKTVLIDFIIGNYPSFRLNEVRTAFQMNAAGRFGEVIDHYQTFSGAYFGKVMTAFRKKSQDLKLYQEQAKEWNKKSEPLHIISDEESVNESYQNYLKIGNWQCIYPLNYDCLKRNGYGVSIEEGTRQRALFNSAAKEKTMFPESKERQFKQWLTAAIFNDFRNQGKKEIRL